GQSTTLFCQTRATTTGAIAAGRFVGTQFTRDADLSWSNPAAFWWVGRETSADCSNDLSWLANVYGHGQLLSYWTSVTAGETIVRGPTIGGWTGWYCTPGPGAYAQSFDDGVEGNIQGLGFPPALAVAAAKAKRDALLPAGYQWYSRDATCTVGNVRDLGSNRVSLTCPLGGVAVWRWDATAKAQVARALAGRTTADARALCNGTAPYTTPYAGVVRGSCTINARGAVRLPADPAKLTIAPGAPRVPAGVV